MKIVYRFCLIILWSFSAFALVDYSSSQSPTKKKTPFVKRNAPPRASSNVSSKTGQAFSLTPSIGYETKDLDYSKVNFYNLGLKIQTTYGISLNTKYWVASSDQLAGLQDRTYQAGNLTTEIGFNWLNYGDVATRMTLDFAFALSWKNLDSEYASERNDKLFTVSSSKRFYNLGLLFQYQFRLVGDVEMAASIGNIHRISTVLGWVATPDISFELEGALYRIGAGEGMNKLSSAVSYSYLEPRLNLQLSRFVELQLGGRFRVERAAVDNKLMSAKLWDLPGVYSNSIFANLNMFI